MYSNIFDSHAHYDDEQFDSDRDGLLSSFEENGVSGVICCGVNAESSAAALALAEKYGFIFAAVGFHPLNLDDYYEGALEKIKELSKRAKCVAIGEIGLDYHYEKESKARQIRLFEQQLALAAELNLPVIIHDREAHEDTLNLIKEYRPRGVVHCFSGSAETAAEIIKAGMYIGFGGAVTFKNAVKPCEAAKAVPDSRLLIETDAPYMSPVPFRGKRCDSRLIPNTAEKLAQIRGCTAQQILDLTAANAKKLFNIG